MEGGEHMKHKVTNKLLTMIEDFEGFSPTPYKAHASEKYWTIGYGHYGKDVIKNSTITKKDAELLLKRDLKVYCSLVEKYDSIYHWTQAEFEALVSFCYNIGNIDTLTSKGKRTREQIATKMLDYCHVGTWVLTGLQNRRKKESEYFRSGSTEKIVSANSGLNVRKSPIDGKIICTIPKNTIVKVIEIFENWSLVDCSCNGKHFVGWVSTKYLESEV